MLLYQAFVFATWLISSISATNGGQSIRQWQIEDDNKPASVRYEPNWKSIDSRPLPKWYDEAKLGIFLHWGVFSVPSFKGAWFWWWWKGPQPAFDVVTYMNVNYKPTFTYADFAPKFTAEFYQPAQWAEIFKASGARYVVLTTKHHEGYCNWNTSYSFNWNSMDVGPKRDLVGDLATALREKGLVFGAYHSLFEFFHPLYLQDKKNNFTTSDFPKAKALPELYELVNKYKPAVIWSDGDWEAPDKYWNSTGFLAWLYNDSPVKDIVVTNDRWGKDIMCHHGGFLTCHDKFSPTTKQERKYEDATTVDKYAWAHRRNIKLNDVQTTGEIVATLAQVVSTGGNLLLNVGPTKDGIIIPVFEERLRELGAWMDVNGEAIYSSKPWTYANDSLTPSIWYTSKPGKIPDTTDLYAITLKWPSTEYLVLASPKISTVTEVTMLGYGGQLAFNPLPGSGVTVNLPRFGFDEMPCKWAWVFKITNVQN